VGGGRLPLRDRIAGQVRGRASVPADLRSGANAVSEARRRARGPSERTTEGARAARDDCRSGGCVHEAQRDARPFASLMRPEVSSGCFAETSGRPRRATRRGQVWKARVRRRSDRENRYRSKQLAAPGGSALQTHRRIARSSLSGRLHRGAGHCSFTGWSRTAPQRQCGGCGYRQAVVPGLGDGSNPPLSGSAESSAPRGGSGRRRDSRLAGQALAPGLPRLTQSRVWSGCITPILSRLNDVENRGRRLPEKSGEDDREHDNGNKNVAGFQRRLLSIGVRWLRSLRIAQLSDSQIATTKTDGACVLPL
jgi:hypothetical protein